MYAPEALFEPTRVPWQVVVHHQMGALKIDTFLQPHPLQPESLPRDLACETFLGFASFLAPHPAVNLNDSPHGGPSSEPILSDQIVKRVAVLCKNDELYGDGLPRRRRSDSRAGEASQFLPFLIGFRAPHFER